MKNSKGLLKLMFIQGNTEHKILKINPNILRFAAWSVPLGTIFTLIIYFLKYYFVQ